MSFNEAKKAKKGQLIFEFVVASVIFIIIVLYILSVLNSSLTSSSYMLYQNEEESKAIMISDYFISLGLRDDEMGHPVIEKNRIGPTIGILCNNDYDNFIEKFDLGNRKFHVSVWSSGLGLPESCGQSPPSFSTNVDRLILARDSNTGAIEAGNLRVSVW